jgi:HD-GYP domain-containing protein (c-di-GMP phosphodiesterase class II)
MGIPSDQTSFAARLIAVANEFDVLTHGTPRRQARGLEAAVAGLLAQRHRKLDAHAVDLCVTVVQRLRSEVPSLDDYLAHDAQHAPPIAARRRIHELLHAPIPGEPQP